MSRLLSTVLLITAGLLAQAQPATEVYLFNLEKSDTGYRLSQPINVSDNAGYDNQPSFSSDGQTLYFTSWQADEQTDIISYDLSTQGKSRVTRTDGSEYSPTEAFTGKGFSTIILERDGRQLLWKYEQDGSNPKILVPDLKIGYHCWYDKNTLFSFVLGEPPTLQKSNLKTGKNEIIDERIGRSLHRIPGQKQISYISKENTPWQIIAFDPKTNQKTILAETLASSEDMAWMPDAAMIMGSGSKLYYRSADDSDWSLLIDLSVFNLSGITRLAVSPKGDRIAVVVNE